MVRHRARSSRHRFGFWIPLFLFAACSPDTSTFAPPPTGQASIASASSLDDLVDDLFTRGHRNAAANRIRNVERQFARGEEESAREQMFALLEWTFERHENGDLADPNGGAPPTTEEAVATFVGELFALVGESLPPVPPGALGPAGAAEIVDEDGGDVVPELAIVGVRIPAGAFDGPTLVTISPLPPTVPPLPTGLTQFRPYYDISASSQPLIDVTVGLCYLDDPPDAGGVPVGFPDARLRIAHPDPANPQTVEILTRVAVPPFLDCAGQAVPNVVPNRASILPGSEWVERKLSDLFARFGGIEPGAEALARAHRGLGGLTSSFSPFAVVDIGSGGTISAVSGDNQTGPNGAPLANPIVIEVRDALGAPLPGVTVDFTVFFTYGPGLDGTFQPVSAATDALGRAQSTWTLSDEGEANRGTATVAGFAASPPFLMACGTFTGSTLGAFLQSIDSQSGDVTINGGDSRRPIGSAVPPFRFDWGDGTFTDSFFAASHTYANTSQNYTVTVTATYCDGTTDSVTVPVDFVSPPIP